jgi:hypothetical protein
MSRKNDEMKGKDSKKQSSVNQSSAKRNEFFKRLQTLKKRVQNQRGI